MPKVLRIINRFNLGGPTYNATFLARFLTQDYETLLVGGVHDKGEIDSLHIPEKYGVKPIILSNMHRTLNPLNDLKTFFQLVKIIREFKPDIVHTHAAKAGALGRIAAWYCKVPVIVHTYHGHVFHSYFSRFVTKIVLFVERFLARLSTAIVTISPKQFEEIVHQHKICSSEKAHIVRLGFDLQQFNDKRNECRIEIREKYAITHEEVAIAIIGRLAPIKNHALFLESLTLLKNNPSTYKVFIVGDGSEKENVLQKIATLPKAIKERIVFTSWIKDIATFNSGMDIICLSSDNEGTPVSLIEAQASGVAVVSTNVGGVEDIIKDGETGFIVPKKNKELFSERLDELIHNTALRLKMGENGWKNVKNTYDYTILVKNMEHLYNQLLKN